MASFITDIHHICQVCLWRFNIEISTLLTIEMLKGEYSYNIEMYLSYTKWSTVITNGMESDEVFLLGIENGGARLWKKGTSACQKL